MIGFSAVGFPLIGFLPLPLLTRCMLMYKRCVASHLTSFNLKDNHNSVVRPASPTLSIERSIPSASRHIVSSPRILFPLANHIALPVTLYNPPLSISTEGQTKSINGDKVREWISIRCVGKHNIDATDMEWDLPQLVSHNPTLRPQLYCLNPKESDLSVLPKALSVCGVTRHDIPHIDFAIYSTIPEINGTGYICNRGSVGTHRWITLEYRRVWRRCLVSSLHALDNAPSHGVRDEIGMQNRGVWPLACFGGVSGRGSHIAWI